ncbi:MAG: hypothetical protein WD969_09625 [Paracoccaceae bacterium]
MINFMCFEITPDGGRNGLFTHSFSAAPAIGDFVSFSQGGGGAHYEVFGRGFAADGGGDLYLSLIGDNDELELWLAQKGSGFNG